MIVPDAVEVFERVCEVLWDAGFEIAHTRPAGLQVGLRARGVLVGWRPDDSTPDAPASSGECADTPAGQTVVRNAVTRALEVILRQADCLVVPFEGDLLVPTAPAGASRPGSGNGAAVREAPSGACPVTCAGPFGELLECTLPAAPEHVWHRDPHGAEWRDLESRS